MNRITRKDLSILIAKYSLTFIVFAFLCVLIYFWFGHKSMMDINDGLTIRYTWFVYSGKLLKRLLKNIFIDHVYELPMWDRTIGIGGDYSNVTSLITNPLLCLLSALVPNQYSEYAFNFVVIFRLYLAGLTFLLFANEKGYKYTNAIAGAMVYVFSGTTFIIFSQISFSSTYILFPLILLGADRVWKKQQDLLYFLVLTYSTYRTYYFTYMMLIILVIYCVIRFFCEEGRSLKKFFSLLGRFVILTLLSLIIGFGINLPGLFRLSSLSRLSKHFDIEFIDFEVINRIFSYGFTYIGTDGDAIIGVSSFVVVAAICLLVSKKKEPITKICLSLCLLSFAFPYIGSVFNGFNYPTYRYIFSLIFCVAYLVTVSFDSIKEFKGKIWYFSLGASLIYGVICFLFIDDYSVLSAFSLLFSVLAVGLINLFDQYLKTKREKLYIAVILISCMLIGYTCFYVSIGPKMMERGSLYETVFINGGTSIRKSVDNPLYRTDVINPDFADTVMNSSMVADISGFDLYCSDQNQLVEDYYYTLNVIGNPMEFSVAGFRGRCYLEVLNACNYIARYEENDTCIRVPYSYDYVKTEDNYSLYRSNKGVSLVYFYDDVISKESYMNMDPLMRETNLMYSMVVDEPKQPEAEIISDMISIPFEIDNTKNVIIDGNKIVVQEDGGYITLKPDSIEAGQISVYLTGLRNSDVNNWHYRNAVALLDADNNMIVVDYSAMSPTTDKYYYGNDDIVFSFESVDEKINKIGVIFCNKGEYNLDDIKIFSRPYEQMDQTLEAFYEHADMENISYDYSGNHLNITATADSDKYLYISIPYSEGWNAKVDGQAVEIISANIAFMAIPLTSGTHIIEMTYCFPHFYLGLSISAIGAVLSVGYFIFEKKKGLKKS